MKNILFKTCLLAVASLLTLTACKKDKEGGEAAKTLNKSALTNNKTWYNQGSTIIHIFKSNGVYSNTGTWSWTSSTSDTLELYVTPSSLPVYWKIFWNTEHEMSCKRVSSSSSVETYKDQGW